MRSVGVLALYLAFIMFGALTLPRLLTIFHDTLDTRLGLSDGLTSNEIQVAAGVFAGVFVAAVLLGLAALLTHLRDGIFGAKRAWIETPLQQPVKEPGTLLVDASLWFGATTLLAWLLHTEARAPVMPDQDPYDVFRAVSSATCIALLIAIIALRKGLISPPFHDFEGDERYKENLLLAHFRSVHAVVAFGGLIVVIEAMDDTVNLPIGAWFLVILSAYKTFNFAMLYWLERRDDVIA
ncbi:hypothetical protein [Cognatiyoonia sp. IB215182]|uniref:hypothetical protein n=1 Tax=Cognatiyoonia sp. IB215182 TaxID=3097353 RepID=UPI002A1691C0|nr:hypothetical protein [Cognatiyoonia sp. IB215182]MDX8351254.1 hypothetical protein [Cognatiyoonia sp. IB215182]